MLAEASGLPAIMTAIGGVVVSMVTVWVNAQRSTKTLAESEHRQEEAVDQVSGEIERMAGELVRVKSNNQRLRAEVQALKEQGADQLSKITDLQERLLQPKRRRR